MLSIIPQPYKFVAIATIFAASLAGAYAYGRHDGSSIERAAQNRAQAAAEAAGKLAAQAAAEAIAQIKVKNVTIRQELEREVRENTIYRDCRSGPIGLRLVNAALTNTAQPPGDQQLPAAHPDDR